MVTYRAFTCENVGGENNHSIILQCRCDTTLLRRRVGYRRCHTQHESYTPWPPRGVFMK